MDDDLAYVWYALSDPTRRRILDSLREQPQTTGHLSDLFPDVSRFAVMKHLTVLEKAELIAVRRRGRERWNYLNAVPLQRIYERWLQPYEAEWASNLLSLKRHVERGEAQKMMDKAMTLDLIDIQQEVTIAGSAEVVFKAVTDEVGAWWGAPYLNTTEAKNVVLEPKIGGRFYEDWGKGQGAQWGVVTGFKRNAWLEITGSIGMAGVVHGVLSYELEILGDNQTRLKLSHKAMGEVAQKHAGYSAGWQDLLDVRLRAFVEQGIRYGVGHEPPPAKS